MHPEAVPPGKRPGAVPMDFVVAVNWSPRRRLVIHKYFKLTPGGVSPLTVPADFVVAVNWPPRFVICVCV